MKHMSNKSNIFKAFQAISSIVVITGAILMIKHYEYAKSILSIGFILFFLSIFFEINILEKRVKSLERLLNKDLDSREK